MAADVMLEQTIYTPEQLATRPEGRQIALAGRSNVGKSSLINALAGRKKLAKISSTPGKTRSINYYKVSPHDFFLVDLPGYGYASASHTERRKWAELLDIYFSHCGDLKGLGLLLDCRLPPQEIDIKLASFAMKLSCPLLPVLTKTDKCNRRDQTMRQREWETLLGARPILTSAANRRGIEELWRALIDFAGHDAHPSSPAPDAATEKVYSS